MQESEPIQALHRGVILTYSELNNDWSHHGLGVCEKSLSAAKSEVDKYRKDERKKGNGKAVLVQHRSMEEVLVVEFLGPTHPKNPPGRRGPDQVAVMTYGPDGDPARRKVVFLHQLALPGTVVDKRSRAYDLRQAITSLDQELAECYDGIEPMRPTDIQDLFDAYKAESPLHPDTGPAETPS